MTDAVTAASCPFRRALDAANRADPYPHYAALPEAPTRLDDGRYVVRSYEQVRALLHDPRVTSAQSAVGGAAHNSDGGAPPARLDLIGLDPPEHDRLRRIMMRSFGPPNRPDLVASLEGPIRTQTDALIDALAGRDESDVVADLAHPLPLAMICQLMDIPAAHEAQFGGWVDTIMANFGTGDAQSAAVQDARAQLGGYLTGIALSRKGGTGTDLLSGLVNDAGPEGRVPEESVGAMATLLLIAGHETTVNLIANGVLTLLRHPGETARMRGDPTRVVGLVEELLRYEPPVQFMPSRTALRDLTVGGVTIPAGSHLVLLVAAANRDPDRFDEPDRFDPGRGDNQHLGFGSGVHSCFGAPLARLEAQTMLQRFAERVIAPRLLAEPPYRPSPLLRGPSALRVGYDGIAPA